MFYLIAFLSGFLTIISFILNSKYSSKTDLLRSSRMNFIAGMVVLLPFIILNPSILNFKKESFLNVPIWAYFGGMLGVMVVILGNHLVKNMASIYVTLFIFIGQLLTGLTIDYFLGININMKQLIGISIIFMGLLYNLNIDKKQLS
ncbi:DMT family transporter [Peptostreptococcaceae bacterium AGR-M142]